MITQNSGFNARKSAILTRKDGLFSIKAKKEDDYFLNTIRAKGFAKDKTVDALRK